MRLVKRKMQSFPTQAKTGLEWATQSIFDQTVPKARFT